MLIPNNRVNPSSPSVWILIYYIKQIGVNFVIAIASRTISKFCNAFGMYKVFSKRPILDRYKPPIMLIEIEKYVSDDLVVKTRNLQSETS
jgi:hypothetical protein